MRTYLWIQETDSSASMNKGTCLLSICTESHAQESASFCVPTFRSAAVRSNTASINKLASFSKIFDFEEVALLFQALLLMGRWSELAAAFQLLLSGQQTPGEKRNSIAALSGQKMDKSCGSPASENAGRAPLKVPMHWGLAGPKLSLLPMYGGELPSQKRAMSLMGPPIEQVEQDLLPVVSM